MKRDRWLGIELRHFAALDAIAKERSFRAAAARLGYVQSAISRQIAFLEDATGVRLIERSQGPRPVHLTDAGQVVLAHADDILARIAAAKSDLAELAGGRAGEIRVGVFGGADERPGPRDAHLLRALSAGRRDRIGGAAGDASLLEQLQDGCIDLAFVNLPLQLGPFAAHELMRAAWVLVVASDTETDSRTATPTLEEISRLPLILLKADPVGVPIESRLGGDEAALRVVFRTDLVETALALVAAEVGAVLPGFAVDGHDSRTTVVELGDLVPPGRVRPGLAPRPQARYGGCGVPRRGHPDL